HLVHVFNRLTYEQSVYNPVRSKRPSQSASGNVRSFVDKVNHETEKNCDLCSYARQTAVDELGRHETAYTVRMSNSFKIERWHGMVITKNSHHPTNLSSGEVLMLFEDAILWASQIQDMEPAYKFPHLAWDTMYKSGASQIHPHVHVTVSPDHFYGLIERFRHVSRDYFQKTRQSYFSSLIQVYSSIGLAVRYGSAVALPTIAGVGDMEVMLLSEEPSRDLYLLLYFVIKAYHQLDILCYR
ncbi:UNVERIFIED_CONTAM: hypothetical protein GTU68_026565, partial [Idotea baltica]|nr:hypothetical protein [Idotea baltica]